MKVNHTLAGFPAWLAVAACSLLAGCTAASSSRSESPPADLVLVNGGIYTVAPEHRWAEAAAVRDGRFVAVGSNAEIRSFSGPETRVIDLAGHMALPGFHDAHVHPIFGGYGLLGCNLENEHSVAAILAKLRDCAARQPDGWLEGQAFDLGLFGQNGPDKSLLDAIDAERPIVAWGSDGHNAWVNSEALRRAGITAATPDPDLGVIERNADGTPSGTVRETAQELIRAAMPKPTPEFNAKALAAAIRHLNSLGITAFVDASVGLEDYQAYQAVERAGNLTTRVVTSLTWRSGFAKHSGEEWERVLAGRHAYESARIDNGSVKIFLDGVLEGETAALLQDYVGLGHNGKLIVPPAELDAAVSRFDAMGLQVHMHAIGDRAVRAGLDAVEVARRANGPSDNRHHIAHLQMIDAADIPRFAELGVTANFQALWAWPDEWITQLNLPVLGQRRVDAMYPIGSVVRAGGRIVGGSDWNVSSANPLDAIETAVRRQNPDTGDGPVLNADERVSLERMIRAYTLDAAWLMHQAERVGSIEVGKQADVVVLDRDLFAVPATEINQARVVMTLLDGETVWPDEGR